jgi:antitoxin component YwqK of YwqJK toxin-antitoxin module
MIEEIKCVIYILIVCNLINSAIAEMPQKPNYEDLCEASELVISASYISGLPETIKLDRNYSEFFFEIDEYYKGKTKDPNIAVLIPIRWDEGSSVDSYIFPAYQEGKKYFLFLKKYKGTSYIRVKIDDVWGERLFDPNEETVIQKEIEEQKVSERWLIPEDNLTYGIPHEAHEREVLLSEYQTDRYLKIIQYLVNDEIAGERGWYKNGVMAYEYPYKNGLRHGIARTWRDDGSLYHFYCYRKDRYHGYLLTWNNLCNLEITFWVRGNNVSKDEYIKESKNNRTLPQVVFK